MDPCNHIAMPLMRDVRDMMASCVGLNPYRGDTILHKGESRKMGESGKSNKNRKVTLLGEVSDEQSPNPLVLSLPINVIWPLKLLPALQLRLRVSEFVCVVEPGC